MIYQMIFSDELYHHGILGQKWGVRRYQKEDGTYTQAGKDRYSKSDAKREYKARNDEIISKTQKLEEQVESKYKRGDTLSKEDQDTLNKRYSEQKQELKDSKEQYKKDVERAYEGSYCLP